ncbi:MAG: DUF1801 domain-containing protein [Colwellia sp.]|nr:DUF1801 domain-containing protein [Colwellia sp.]MCW9080284.1 DUF1801 domain-containing protein [Colwellia sp.]
MHSEAKTPQAYIDSLSDERKAVINQLRGEILKHLPDGFEEAMGYGMLAYVVPLKLYPKGYHCNPKLPLPFMNLASQKNFIALYHSGIYADEALLDWFVREYPNHCKHKLDMGKCCIRFKNFNNIPYQLIGELVAKMTVQQWIELYEESIG